MTDPTSPPIHVLVTGSTRGIGAAAAAALEARGARVVRHGSRNGAGVLGADLAEPDAADGLWARAMSALDGRIDVLVNNAGVFEAVEIDASDAAWRGVWGHTMQVNLQSAANLCRRAILHFR